MLSAGLLLPAVFGTLGEGQPRPHDTHVSYARVVIDTSDAFMRIRLFKDDLTLALRTFAESDSLLLGATPEIDSLFLAYLNETFELNAGDVRLRPQIITSGEDELRAEGGVQDIWWYELVFESEAVITGVTLNDRVLFETYSDQRNILKLYDARTDREHSFYFVEGSDSQSIEVGQA